jgi:hypothetical protein
MAAGLGDFPSCPRVSNDVDEIYQRFATKSASGA